MTWQVDPSLVDINIPFVQELCSLQLRMGKAAEALESCQRAVQLNPQLLDCAVNRVRRTHARIGFNWDRRASWFQAGRWAGDEPGDLFGDRFGP